MSALHDDKLKFLEEKANEIRQDLLSMLFEAESGLNHNPKKPGWKERDRLVLSNGHICPVQYVALAHAGYFPINELKTLRKLNSRLQGHPHRGALPGIETTSGPLGSGLSQAAGMALAARMDKARHRVYCLMSDGEHNEGNTWEAVMFAGKNRLSNLTAVMDRNNIQIDGFTEEVMPLEPLRAKYEAFNWNVIDVDGHNIEHIISAVHEAKAIYEKPTMIIAHTIPGKGVSYMESNYLWHGIPPGASDIPGSPPKEDQLRVALDELRTLGGRIESEHQ
jgi:transketolase